MLSGNWLQMFQQNTVNSSSGIKRSSGLLPLRQFLQMPMRIQVFSTSSRSENTESRPHRRVEDQTQRHMPLSQLTIAEKGKNIFNCFRMVAIRSCFTSGAAHSQVSWSYGRPAQPAPHRHHPPEMRKSFNLSPGKAKIEC
jgi:hypothetical protein